LLNQPHNSKTPIIAVSADPGSRGGVMSSIEPLTLGLDKPVDIDRLAQILDRVVIRAGAATGAK
jgi:hypothetical protein